jgi:hypothetical protein
MDWMTPIKLDWKAVDYTIDLQSDRKERVEALQALQIEGFTDYRSLLA